MEWQKDGHKRIAHCGAPDRTLAAPAPLRPLSIALLPFGAGCAAFGVAVPTMSSARD